MAVSSLPCIVSHSLGIISTKYVAAVHYREDLHHHSPCVYNAGWCARQVNNNMHIPCWWVLSCPGITGLSSPIVTSCIAIVINFSPALPISDPVSVHKVHVKLLDSSFWIRIWDMILNIVRSADHFSANVCSMGKPLKSLFSGGRGRKRLRTWD